jgi:hypothetical protein
MAYSSSEDVVLNYEWKGPYRFHIADFSYILHCSVLLIKKKKR